MSDQTPQQQDPIIPPQMLLYIAVFGLVVALVVAFTQPTFSVVGVAGLGIALLSLIGWVILNPEGFRDFITGRNLRFGGTSVIVTILVLTALVALYTVIRGRNWRIDVTETDTYSLTEVSQQAVEALGADPSLPSVKLIGFYGNTQSGRRDRDTVLLDQYVAASNGKISYEFVNPERDIELTQQYGISRDGTIAVVRLDADGQPDIDNRETVAVLTQEALTNAILRVASTGDFRAYLLGVEGGIELSRTDTSLNAGFTTIRDELVDRYKWTVEQIGVLDILGNRAKLEDDAANGIVLVIPGGTAPLNEESFELITNYLDAGGDALIFADAGLDDNGLALATADNFTAYLNEHYGASFSRDVVLDPTQTLRGSPLSIYSRTFEAEHPITAAQRGRNIGFVFNIAHPLTVSDTPPDNVTVTPIISSSNAAFTKSVADIVAENTTQADSDPTGPFPLAVAAENTETGSRVLLVGSTSLLLDRYSQFLDVANFDVVFASVVWATRFDEHFTNIEQVPRAQRAQDLPISATSQDLSTINFITVIALPFGILALGLFVWWTGRERAANLTTAKES